MNACLEKQKWLFISSRENILYGSMSIFKDLSNIFKLTHKATSFSGLL